MAKRYDHKQLEAKWIDKWRETGVYGTKAEPEVEKKRYLLGMFPYPSGEGLHTGHVRIFTACDVLARFYRSQGKDVLLPTGWDAFGLPAENAAIKAKTNPMEIVPGREANFKRQMEMMGLSFDWSRAMSTTDPEYYQWTQWIFSKLYQVKSEKGERLVYRKEVGINWCPYCKTGLANEEVMSDGTHERCGTKVEQRQRRMWMMRISGYGDRLLDNLIHYDWVAGDGEKRHRLDWPEGILAMQREWIGKKTGVKVRFEGERPVEVFTTRLDTIFGVTFIVVAPEVARGWMDAGWKASEDVREYVEKSLSKVEQQRLVEAEDKSGVETGLVVTNPANGEKVPVWVGDYVLGSVGTGAVMGVPGSDERDFGFAKKFGLEVRQVVAPAEGKQVEGELFVDDGVLVNSGKYTGKASGEAREAIFTELEKEGAASRQVSYHLRDWVFSRQRYWGEPFPLIYCDKCGDENGVVLVPESELPVRLPKLSAYEPSGTGESPLSKAEEWVRVKCPVCGGEARRETDTMPNWAGSCWYFLYFALSHEVRQEIARQRGEGKTLSEIWSGVVRVEVEKWLPVDWYLGGAEHAVLHLLYARFWMMVLSDLGLLGFEEPFLRLRSVGMVLAEDGRKMSKSWGNVVNPDEMVERFGADATRLYEMFMGPWDQAIAWDVRPLSGCYRLVERLWKLGVREIEAGVAKTSEKLGQKLERSIVKIERDTRALKFNTAVAALMELCNTWEERAEVMAVEDLRRLLVVVAVYAPFVAEELYESLGGKGSVTEQLWPVVDEGSMKTAEVTVAVQVNGKLRATVSLPAEHGGDKEMVVRQALQDKNVAKWVGEKEPRVIFVPGKVLNLVI